MPAPAHLAAQPDGPYMAGATTFTPAFSPHGVSVRGYREAAGRAAAPVRHPDEELWIQIESAYALQPTAWTVDAAHRDTTYEAQFDGFDAARLP